MKKILLLTFPATLLLMLSFRSISPTQPSVNASPLVNQDRIKDATLIIVVESILNSQVTLAYGMGTLVRYQGVSYLVTHNHYGDLLQDKNILELRDARYRLIRTMYGYEFKSLIVYQDAGTLVLRLPDWVEAAFTPAELGDSQQGKPEISSRWRTWLNRSVGRWKSWRRLSNGLAFQSQSRYICCAV